MPRGRKKAIIENVDEKIEQVSAEIESGNPQCPVERRYCKGSQDCYCRKEADRFCVPADGWENHDDDYIPLQ